jgi:3'-phosphoadenosine 5'-phosphosulfate sulfotransferase (PAPS reductase)/FAD synthetase
MNDLLHASIEFIRESAHAAKRPAAMLSFGKDSMVMASLIRDALMGLHGLNGNHFPLTHGFPVPVLYHRDPWFNQKHIFAEEQIRAWAMEVHDFAPLCCGIKVNDKLIELVARYPLGASAIDIPKNTCSPEEYPRRDFICGLRDWIGRPKTAIMEYPWDLLFIGHKDSDVDPFEGAIPLKTNLAQIGGVRLAFPLKEWREDDLWDYIDQHHVPVDARRYHGRREWEDKWFNNDYTHACTACVDPRRSEKTVFCPKLKRQVPNVGAYVLQLRENASYIERGK